jgi:ribonuclease Y
MENIATSFQGVEKSFAISAGREVRVIVIPEQIDDATATKLAHDIADKIEKSVTYPGQVKVTVIRETRAEAVAK